MMKPIVGFKWLLGLMLPILSTLTACSDNNTPPACKSELADQLIQSVYSEKLHQDRQFNGLDMTSIRNNILQNKQYEGSAPLIVMDLTYNAETKPSFVKELSYDKESKIRTCSATVSVLANQKLLDQYMQQVPQQYFNKDKQEIKTTLAKKAIFENNVRYELQKTDDGNVQIKIQGINL